eukprot:6206712-Pyramimonas_sp.AAC.1
MTRSKQHGTPDATARMRGTHDQHVHNNSIGPTELERSVGVPHGKREIRIQATERRRVPRWSAPP